MFTPYPNPLPEDQILFIVQSRDMPQIFDPVRLLKAMDIVVSGYVREDGLLAGWRTYLIESNQGIHASAAYRVTGNNCTCPDAMNGHTCKHVIARVIYERYMSQFPIPIEVHHTREAEILAELGF